MTREDVTNYKGKEYVSMSEFAKRVGAGIATIKRKAASGTLPFINIEKRKTKYIEWEAGKKMWDMMRHDVRLSNAGKKSTDKKYGKVPDKADSPVVSEPTVTEPEVSEVEEMAIDLSSFDKTKYADCLLPNNEFDYDKLKLRLTAETYAQKLQQTRGQLVEKTEVIAWAKKLGVLVNTGLESIPQKYTSVLIAQCQGIIARRLGITDFEFNEKERTELRNTLKDCGPEIMKSIKLMIMEITEDE